MRKLFVTAVAALALSASAASATVLRITDILDGSTGGFGYSLFHSQTSGRMNGATLEDPDILSGGGTWDTISGAINFAFSLVGGGLVSATGTLNTGGTYNGGQYIAVGGSIDMTFTGATNIWNGTHTFTFAPGSQSGANLPANGVFADLSQLNLWGDNGNYGTTGSTCGVDANQCVGVDLGIALAPVPLPAAGFLLIGALGGLGFAARRKRKAV